MRISARLANGLGLIALAASFALASPGVRVVRAEAQAGVESPAPGVEQPGSVAADQGDASRREALARH